MPNRKKNAPLVTFTNTATLSHETANQLTELSIESKTNLVNLLKFYFGDNKADDEYYIEQYWNTLTASMSCQETAPFQRQNFVLLTQEHIQAIKVLYSLFKELKLS